jgi:hypothetical protein
MKERKAVIKILDLPRDAKVSNEEMKKVRGGGIEPSPFMPTMTSTIFKPLNCFTGVGGGRRG